MGKSKNCLTSDKISERQYITTPYQSGWVDVRKSKRWFVRSLLLTLCSLVPILNWCIRGFAARWGREVCLGVNRRLPSSIVDDDTFISGAKIWFVNLCWVIVLALVGCLLWMIPVAGPILVCLLLLIYAFVAPLLNFQVALSSKFSIGFTGIGRAFSLLWKKPIKTLGSAFSPALVVGLIACLVNAIIGGILLVLIGSSLISTFSDLISGFLAGTDWSTLMETFFNNFDSIYTVAAYVLFAIYFIFKFAGVIASLWIYRSIGHLIAREAPEWLKEEGLVDTSCIGKTNVDDVEPYVPMREIAG